MNKIWKTTGITLIALALVGGGIWYFLGATNPANSLASIKKHTPSAVENQGITRMPSALGSLKEVEKMVDHGYYSLATIELQKVIKENPKLLSPYILLGEIYTQMRNGEKLNNLIELLAFDFPDNPAATLFTVRKYINDRDFVGTTSYIRELTTPSPEVRFYQGVLLALQNDHEAADAIFSELETLPVKQSNVSLGESGLEEDEDNDTSTIVPEFKVKAQDITIIYEEFENFAEGKEAHLLTLIAKSLAEHKEYILAEEFARTALTEDIDYIDAWIVRGFVYLETGRYDAALEDLKHAYELDPLRPETQYFLALAHVENGNITSAVLFFEQALEYNFPFSEEVRWKLSDLYLENQNYDKVIELYRDLLGSSTDQTQFASALHKAINIINNPELALELSQKLIDEDDQNSFNLNMHGWALIANERYGEAEKYLLKAQDINPDDARTYLNLGTVYEKEGEWTKAKENYKISYELGQTTDNVSLTNLAADNYNRLLKQNPVKTTDREASSP